MAALSEADARDLLTLAARNIAKRRAMLEALETAAKEARETVANAEESAADARALDSFDSFSTEFVSTLAGILKRPAVERQEAFVSLQIDATGSDPLNLLRAPRAERLTAAALLLMSMLQGRSYDARERALFRDCSFDLGLKAAQLPELERKVNRHRKNVHEIINVYSSRWRSEFSRLHSRWNRPSHFPKSRSKRIQHGLFPRLD